MSEKCDANTEVYARVSGFFRPVQQWNRGKKEEYRQRRPFDPVKAGVKEGPMPWSIENLISTSVDDCRATLQSIANMAFLRELLAECERLGHKTRALVVKRRIRGIERRQ